MEFPLLFVQTTSEQSGIDPNPLDFFAKEKGKEGKGTKPPFQSVTGGGKLTVSSLILLPCSHLTGKGNCAVAQGKENCPGRMGVQRCLLERAVQVGQPAGLQVSGINASCKISVRCLFFSIGFSQAK